MSGPGTFERLINGFGMVLSPLGRGLEPDNAPAFFAELGIPMTAAQAGSIGGAATTIKNGLEKLAGLIQDINQAVVDEKWGKVVEKGITAAAELAKVIDAFVTLSNQLGNLPAVTPAMVNQLPERLFNLLLGAWIERNVIVKIEGIDRRRGIPGGRKLYR